MCFLIKHGRHVSHSERIDPIDYGGQRSKVKVTIDMCGNKLVNMKETKPMCATLSNFMYHVFFFALCICLFSKALSKTNEW